MCKAITKSGKVCKNKSETLFCHLHQETPLHEPELTLEEKRKIMISKILFSDDYILASEVLPLFEGMDLTSETLNLINRAKLVYDWSIETYNTVISSYLDDGVEENRKYDILRATIAQSSKKDIPLLKYIQINDLCIDMNILFLTFTLSKGRLFVESFRKVHNSFQKLRKNALNIHREENIKKLVLKEIEKYTPICDDVRRYEIASFL